MAFGLTKKLPNDVKCVHEHDVRANLVRSGMIYGDRENEEKKKKAAEFKPYGSQEKNYTYF